MERTTFDPVVVARDENGREVRYTPRAAARVLRALNVGGAYAFEEAAWLLEVDALRISPYLFAERIRKRVAYIALSEDPQCATPFPCLPEADARGVYLGWGRSRVRLLWPLPGGFGPTPEPRYFHIHLDLAGVPEVERKTHERVVALEEHAQEA